MKDIVVSKAENSVTRPVSLFDLTPRAKIEYAAEVAGVLKDVIRQQRLSVKIGPNEYVKAEAWATLGTILGVLPRERSVDESANGDFIAHVDLIRQSDGAVIGGGSALCSMDEKRWASADRYARRSMAVTRATGKAYRLAFAWIVTLAGYQPTPAEEMPASQGFDPENSDHIDKLEAILERKNIDKALWVSVATALRGRPSTDIDSVIATVSGDPKNAN